MSIESFFTSIVPQPGQKAAGHTALSGNAAGGLGPGGINFLDFILSQLGQNGTEEEIEIPDGKPDEALQSDNPLLDKEAQLEIAKILAENPEIAEQIEQYGLEGQAALTETLALNQQAFDEILKPFVEGAALDGLEIDPALKRYITAQNLEQDGSAPGILGSLQIDTGTAKSDANKLKALLNKLDGFLNDGNPAFLTSNFTPEQVFDLKQKILAVLNRQIDTQINAGATTDPHEQPSFDGIFAALIQLTQPQNKGTPADPALQNINDLALKKQDFNLPARLNNLIVGGEDGAFQTSDLPETEMLGGEFKNILKEPKPGTPVTPDIKTPSVKPDLSTLQGWNFASFFGGLFGSQAWADEYTSAASPLQSTTTLSTLTNAITQAQHASQPHPATQMVAATVQKALGDGQSKSITLQLDPPDLGKVEVRMEFGKDKSVKTSILSEKPETFMMLQRDAQMLERILQESGLNADGGINFELAQEGYDFNHNGRHDGHAGRGTAPENGNEGEQMIETTMNWHVDPNTGHMRYNLMV